MKRDVLGSSAKIPKVAINTSNDPEDRLSSFPDAILCHILSFLPTKCAAVTSILSTRWKYVFLGVPSIDLDSSLRLNLQKCDDYSEDEEEHFKNFVSRQLMLCQASSITEFRLKCKILPKNSLFGSWIAVLLWRNVQVLDIEGHGYHSNGIRPPIGIFSCGTLVVLKLCSKTMVLRVPELVCLQHLKVLHLRHLTLQFESDNLRLATGYPLLEDLRMDEIRFSNDAILLEISIPTLRKFGLLDCFHKLSRMNFNTPHLQYFKYKTSFATELYLCKCELVEADLSFSSRLESLDISPETTWFNNLLREVLNVKALKFSGALLQALYNYTGSLPQLPNLTHLELTESDNYLRKPMWILLERASKLEVVVCDMGNGKETGYGVPEFEPPCLTLKLREIRIKNFRGSEVEVDVVRYFLQHGAALEKIIIHGAYYRDWPSSILKQLLNLGRNSPKCVIELP